MGVGQGRIPSNVDEAKSRLDGCAVAQVSPILVPDDCRESGAPGGAALAGILVADMGFVHDQLVRLVLDGGPAGWRLSSEPEVAQKGHGSEVP